MYVHTLQSSEQWNQPKNAWIKILERWKVHWDKQLFIYVVLFEVYVLVFFFLLSFGAFANSCYGTSWLNQNQWTELISQPSAVKNKNVEFRGANVKRTWGTKILEGEKATEKWAPSVSLSLEAEVVCGGGVWRGWG